MTKKKKTETPVDTMPMDDTDKFEIPHTTSVPDNPTDLIYRLNDFYNKNPDYETSVLNISLLMRMAHQEMDKFTRRPHTQVTKVYFDSDAPDVRILR